MTPNSSNNHHSSDHKFMILGVCPDQFPFIQELLDDGHHLVFCGRDQSNIDKLSDLMAIDKYKQGITIYQHNLADKDAILEIAKKEKVEALIPVPLGKVVSTVGYVNSNLNLPGISYESCLNFTDKHQVYKLLKANNLNCATQVDGTGLDKVTFPCIVKPRYGCGSRGVRTAQNRDELLQACEFCKQEYDIENDDEMLIEEFIVGTEYSGNFFVLDGEIKPYLISQKTMTEVPYRQELKYTSLSLADPIVETITTYIGKCAQVLGINNSVLNCDVIVCPGRGPFVVDISARFPGNYLGHVAKFKGIDLGRLYVDFILNHRLPNIPKTTIRSYMSLLEIGSGTILSIPDSIKTESFLAQNNLKIGDKITKAINGRDLLSRGFAICLDNNIDLAKQRVDEYLKQFALNHLKK